MISRYQGQQHTRKKRRQPNPHETAIAELRGKLTVLKHQENQGQDDEPAAANDRHVK